MSPRVVSAADWRAARKELRAAEEEAARTLQQIANRRREMPAVIVEQDCQDETVELRHRDKYSVDAR
jgi:predicted dithiol-disulfide oxidoreductase (DUF899 family)